MAEKINYYKVALILLMLAVVCIVPIYLLILTSINTCDAEISCSVDAKDDCIFYMPIPGTDENIEAKITPGTRMCIRE